MDQELTNAGDTLREELDSTLAQGVSYDDWSDQLKHKHEMASRDSTVNTIRFQLLFGIPIVLATIGVDALAIPSMLGFAIAWRLFINVPLNLAGLYFLHKGDLPKAKVAMMLSLTAFAVMVMHLASHGDPGISARYSMATVALLCASSLSLPFTHREQRQFIFLYVGATVIAGIWPHPMASLDLFQHIVLAVLVGAACSLLMRRNWEFQARSFLLELREDAFRRELERNNELLRQLSEQDPLTGLPNRRCFDRQFEEMIASRHHADGMVAVMMIDLDHFKAFNDTHGHTAGDECLRQVGQRIEALLRREGGVVARFGGEEFVAALCENKAGDTAALAEELRRTIAALPVQAGRSGKAAITTSIGVSAKPLNGDIDRDALIKEADKALYEAKRAGRNRVEGVKPPRDIRASA